MVDGPVGHEPAHLEMRHHQVGDRVDLGHGEPVTRQRGGRGGAQRQRPTYRPGVRVNADPVSYVSPSKPT